MATEIKLQPLKENVDSVEINEFLVEVGDTVEKDQPILEVQADKSSLEVPSPQAGKIVEFLVEAGDEVTIGTALFRIEATSDNGEESASKKKEDDDEKEKSKDDKDKPPQEEKPKPKSKKESPPPKDEKSEDSEPAEVPAEVPAGPATRRLARELGVDLRQVSGTARKGRVTEEDVRNFVRQLASGGVASGASKRDAPPLPDFEEWGEVERQPLRGIRKATARQMGLAWSLIPHVTQHDEAEITELESFRKEQKKNDIKLTVTAFALKAMTIALREYPRFNASLDAEKGQLILKKYYHIGVAVDTDNGLLVPVIRDVDRKSIVDLAEELREVAEAARKGKLDSESLSGGCFTLTNLGGIGGTSFTPIVNFPEVAILGLSRGRLQPALVEGQLVNRLMLPLSLSYDHRVIDGAEAARFTRRIGELLQNPKLMVLYA